MLVLRGPADSRELLVGRKRRGFGQGYVVAPGGKLEPGETALQAAVRELHEETGLVADPADCEQMARLHYRFPNRPEWDSDVAIFLTDRFAGEPRNSDELDLFWTPVAGLPHDQMWDDERFWLPNVLAGRRLVATFSYNDDNTLVSHYQMQFGIGEDDSAGEQAV